MESAGDRNRKVRIHMTGRKIELQMKNNRTVIKHVVYAILTASGTTMISEQRTWTVTSGIIGITAAKAHQLLLAIICK